MVYVITEDSNSARYFWDKAFDTFAHGSYKLLGLPSNKGGNTTLDLQVNNIIDIIREGDTIAVIFDNIEERKTFSPVKFMGKLQKLSKIYNINIIATTYYCFEELYLSYDEILDMYEKSKNSNSIVIEAIKYVREKLYSHQDYFDTSDIIEKFKQLYKKDSGKNREHFANALLLSVTQALPDWLHISKRGDCFGESGSGRCFLIDCHDIQSDMNKKHVDKQCRIGCKYKCKNCSTKEKLLDLENRSICTSTGLKISGIASI